MKTHKMVKRRWVIVAIVILVLIVVLGILYLMQQDNLKAAANARKYTHEQLLGKREKNRQKVEDAIAEQYPDLHVRDLTEEEKDALRHGTLSREEIIAALLRPNKPEHGGGGNDGDSSEAVTSPNPTQKPASDIDPSPVQTSTPSTHLTPSQADEPENTPFSEETPDPEPPVPTDGSYSEALATLVADIYVMREEYIAQLDEMMARARTEYSAKPESERTHSKLVKWASGYISEASVLEKQCDARMDEVLAKVKALAEEYGEDTEIVDTLAYFYAEEKSIQKSLYIQELERRGIL